MPTEQKELLRQREGTLVRIIEALKAVQTSPEWSTLKTEVFDGVLESLEGRLISESKKLELNPPDIYRLQGQIQWAKKYADLADLLNTYRLELTGIRQQLNPGDGAPYAPDTVIKL